MEILNSEEMAARQRTPRPFSMVKQAATPKDSKPRTELGRFKRFALPVAIVAALGFAATTTALLVRSDPAPAPVAAESEIESDTTPALMPATQEGCNQILTAEDNPALYNYGATVRAVRTNVELNPSSYEDSFRTLLQGMVFALNSYDSAPELAQQTGAELHEYCQA